MFFLWVRMLIHTRVYIKLLTMGIYCFIVPVSGSSGSKDKEETFPAGASGNPWYLAVT